MAPGIGLFSSDLQEESYPSRQAFMYVWLQKKRRIYAEFWKWELNNNNNNNKKLKRESTVEMDQKKQKKNENKTLKSLRTKKHQENIHILKFFFLVNILQ